MNTKNVKSEYKCSVETFMMDDKYVGPDKNFIIQIGERSFKGVIRPYMENDANRIRNSLEGFCYTGKAMIQIFDKQGQYTKIQLATFPYPSKNRRKVTEVTILPSWDSRGNEEVVVGYCDTVAVLKELYTFFLKISSWWHFQGVDVKRGDLRRYNEVKSPIIETFIMKGKVSGVPPIRSHIKHKIVIIPDYDTLWDDENGFSYSIDTDNVIEILNKKGEVEKSVVVPGFYEWRQRYEETTDFITYNPTFDYQQWHEEGLRLTQELRNQLPDCYDVWYRYIDEDRTHHCEDVLFYKTH